MDRRAFLAALGAATTTLAGCTASCPPSPNRIGPPNVPWPAPHGTPSNTGHVTSHLGPHTNPNVREWPLWEFFDADDEGTVQIRSRFTSPVVGDDLVFVASGPRDLRGERSEMPGYLFAIRPTTAEPAWSVRMDRGATGSPGLRDGEVIVPTSDGAVTAYDAATGEERWRRTFDAMHGTPTTTDRRIYLGDTEGTVRALHPDGSDCWSVSRGPPIEGFGLGQRPTARFKPAIGEGRLYALFGRWNRSSSKRPYFVLGAYDLRTGDEAWTHEFETYDRPSAPAVADGTVYLPAGQTLYALDAPTGEKRWHYVFGATRAISTPAIDDARAYVCAGNIHALDLETGDEVWRFVNDWTSASTMTRRQPMYAAPVVAGETVYAGAGALDARTGARRWGEFGNDPDSAYFGYSQDGATASEGPALTDTAMYVAFQSGRLLRFGGGNA